MKGSSSGKIITFYSYKGGTGRSMALANVAWILANNGKSVLAIDWDLEAPGLHSYFYPFLVDKGLTSSDGIIDFIIDFAVEAVTPSGTDAIPEDWYRPYANILRYAAALDHDFDHGGILDFVPAGRQGTSYPTRVNSFDWENFYDNLGGGVFLEAAKDKMRKEYDYILIDSRTGVSDTSGICTVQMPDILVVCFTLNNQSIRGAAAVANSVYEQRREKNLQIFPVPMRIENAEQDKLNERWAYAKKEFTGFPTHIGLEKKDQYWSDLGVPYIPYYAYEEILADFVGSERGANSMLLSMENLTNYLVPNYRDGLSQSWSTDEKPTREQIRAQYEGKDVGRTSLRPGELLEDYLAEMRRVANDKELRESQSDDLMRVDARVRTLAVLGELDTNRKRDLIRYLHEANLIRRQEDTNSNNQHTIIRLDDADLREANLEYIDLSHDVLSGIRGERVNLKGATLDEADLRRSDLAGANLANAALRRASLAGADLTYAVMTLALLPESDLSSTRLKFANLESADLSGANLRSANLEGANLSGAILREVYLLEADLRNVNLSGAEVADHQLAAGKSLEGAIMRNGTKYKSENRRVASVAVWVALLSASITAAISILAGILINP